MLRATCLMLVGACSFVLAGSQGSARAAEEYEQLVRPFIERNCLGCHGAKTAKAGFRIDLLGADFTAASAAEQWKEVIDRINAGEMPPEDKPRPDPKQAAAVVGWVNGRLS